MLFKRDRKAVLSALAAASCMEQTLADFVHYPVTKNKLSKEILAKRDSTSEGLNFVIENEVTLYSVELVMGSNNQTLTAQLDTGSSDLWVLGADKNNLTACDAYLEYAGYLSSSSTKKRSLFSDEKRIVSPHHISPMYDSDVSAGESHVDLAARDSVISELSTLAYTATSYETATGTSDYSSSAASSEVSLVESNCEDFGVFTPSDSTTFKKNNTDTEFYIQYGDLTFAEGYWGSDQLTVNGIAVDGLLFGVANISNSSNVLGISFPQLESSNTASTDTSSDSSSSFTYSNLPQFLKEKGFINKVVFSLYLNSLEATSGDLLFGALDTSKYTGNLYTIPIINIYSRYYDNPIQFDVTLQGSGFVSESGKTTTFSTQYIPGLLDSGTTLLYLPQTLSDMFAAAVNATWDDSVQYYTMACPSDTVKEKSAYVFQFGGINYYVPLSNYILKASTKECFLGIQPQTTQYCVFGDNTLSALYVVYDLEDYEISIAQADYQGASESNIKEISSSVPGATKAPGYSNTWVSTVTKITKGGDIFNGTTAKNPWSATSSVYFQSTSISTHDLSGGESDGSTVTLSTSSAGSSATASSTSSKSSSSTSSGSKKNEAGVNTVGLGSLVAMLLSFVL